MTGTKATWVAAPTLLMTALTATVAWGTPPTVACRRIAASDGPRIDGALTDAAWRQAEWFDRFTQSVPRPGQPATETTAVAFLVDDHNVYVAVRCDDSSPGLIRAQKLRHRDEPTTDDHVQVIFDTYRDQVRGTVFVVNPLGSKEEGLTNGYFRYTWSWDGVWEVKTQITAAGWQAELRVPLRLLRYAGDARQEWGVNVKRVIRRKQEEVYLAAPPPPYDISSLNFAGTLSGVELGQRQRNLQVIPYALGGTVREGDPDTGEDTSRSIEELGLDIKYSLTSDLTLDGTYNTDFAQVESDDEQVNLTRFSLFYPEKRDFFLENADLFSFGHGGGYPGGAPDITPFFSRRIGLHEGETVPIDAGLRLTGKVGRQDIGLLSVRTAPVGELDLDAGWYNVARVRRDLGGRSYVGGIFTDSHRDGFRSTTAGIDGEWYLTQDLSFRADFMRVRDDRSDDDRDAYNLSLDLTTDPWGFLFTYIEVDRGFEPDLGFLRREGYRRKQGLLRRSFRLGRWGIRRLTFRTNSNWFDSLDHGTLESSSSNLECEVELENGDRLQVEATRSFERLFEPFELDPEVIFAAGRYTFDNLEISYESDESRRWGLDAEAVAGAFYDGDRTQVEGNLWVVASRHLRVAGSYSTYDVSTDHGDLDWRLWSLRLDYTHSATLSASGFLQYNSSTGTTVANLRVRWILRNDSDLFLVYNEREEDRFGAPTLRSRELAFKLSYRFFL